MEPDNTAGRIEFMVDGQPVAPAGAFPADAPMTAIQERLVVMAVAIDGLADELENRHRLLSLARTDLQSASNWLARYLSETVE